jgi:flagellar FliL protein
MGIMSDQDDINLEGDASAEASAKKGPSFLPQLLKWVLIALVALVFIVTVVVITVSIMTSNSPNQTAVPVSEEYKGIREELSWYTSVGSISTRSADDIPASVVADMAFGYTLDDKATPAELTSRLIELKDFLRSFFQHKTAEELRNEDKVKIEIRNSINDNILSKSKIKDVRFIKYEIVTQE